VREKSPILIEKIVTHLLHPDFLDFITLLEKNSIEYLVGVLPIYGAEIMVNMLSIIEEQVSKEVTHFGGQIPAGFEVLQRGCSGPIDGRFGRSQSQNNPTHLFPAEGAHRCPGA